MSAAKQSPTPAASCTDRELLEKAAKAAGYWGSEFNCPANVPRAGLWDPLTDDGDALRLAVKLNLMIFPDDDPRRDRRYALVENGTPGSDAMEYHDGDPYAATRRAIVRAAASLCDSASLTAKD